MKSIAEYVKSIEETHNQKKPTPLDYFFSLLKLILIIFFSLGIAITGEIFIGYGPFSFYFITFVVASVSFKVSSQWKKSKFLITVFLILLFWLLFKIYVLSVAGG